MAANEQEPGITAQSTPLYEVLQRNGASAQSVQRSGGGGGADLEGGIVASAQLCYNLCSGEISLVGWVWVGAGVTFWGGWYGAYYFWEGEKKLGEVGHLDCGTCSPACGGGKQEEKGKGDMEHHHGWGLAGFPIVLKPGDWGRFEKMGLEVGLLITPHSLCDADLEVIALMDLLGYVPSLKAPLTAAQAVGKKIGISFECGLGLDISGSVHLCTNENNEITSDNAKVCGGAFLGCGIGLSHDKGQLRGTAPAS